MGENETTSEPGFIVDQEGPGNLYGVFEDNGETGDLYVYDRGGKGITKWLQIYQCSEKLVLRPDDVAVVWSEDFDKVGVLIWGGMRGIIDLKTGKDGRIMIEDRSTPAISDPDWLKGFEWVWKGE